MRPRSSRRCDGVVRQIHQHRLPLSVGRKRKDPRLARHNLNRRRRGRNAIHGDRHRNVSRILSRAQHFKRNLDADERIRTTRSHLDHWSRDASKRNGDSGK